MVKLPTLKGIFNRTQPVRVPASSLKDIRTYEPTALSKLSLNIREFYPTEPAPRAPADWLPGKSYFGWVPREEKIEGTEKKFVVLEHPERQSKILFAGPTIYPIQKRTVRQTTEEGREKYGRMSGSAKDTVKEREYNPADFIPYLNAIEKDKRVTINLTGAGIKREAVRREGYGDIVYKYSDKLTDEPAEKFGEKEFVRSKVTRELRDKEGKPILNPYDYNKPLTVTEKVITGKKAMRFEKDDQQKIYPILPEGAVVNMRATLGEDVDKREARSNAEQAVRMASRRIADAKGEPPEELIPYTYTDKTGKKKTLMVNKAFNPVNWEFTENTPEYAGNVELEAEELARMSKEREEAKFATFNPKPDYLGESRGLRGVRTQEYYMGHEKEPQELAQEEHKSSYDDSAFTVLSHKPKRKPEAESIEYAGSEEEQEEELKSLYGD